MKEDKSNGEFKGYTKAVLESIHVRFDELQKELDRRFTDIDNEIKEIKENHVAHVAADVKNLQAKISVVENHLELNKGRGLGLNAFWVYLGGGIALVASIVALVLNAIRLFRAGL